MLKLPAIARPSDDYRKVAMLGFGIIVLTFGVIGGWAALAPLDSAVTAHGALSVDTNKKTIQHLEGGIVRTILVKEGQKVKAGQVLFELDPTQAKAGYEIAQNQLYSLLAQETRLVAERDNGSTLNFPAELTSASSPVAARAIADETKQFFERRNTQTGQINILNSRIEQFRTAIQGVDRERAAMETQLKLIESELADVQKLYDKGLVPRPRLLALQREQANIQGSIGRSISEHERVEKEINEATLQIRQLRQQMYEGASKDLTDVRAKMADIRERFTVAQDQAKRIDVRSPVDGTAQGLHVFTPGQVIRPGEPMVDIVPLNEELVVKASVSPNDVDNIAVGQTTEVRFPSFHDRTIPVINGTIRTISNDRMVDEATHQPYYLAVVAVDESKLPPQIKGRLKPGYPAEVVVPTGERTVLQYMYEPLTATLRGSLRER
jgi:HlyD family secretion protein/S-layer protein transport system membrane fusion protein